jgi:hypothetical protein
MHVDRIVRHVFDRGQMNPYEATDLKRHSRDEMIKECQEMIDSHTRCVLEIARESTHPIFERTSRHRMCFNKMDYWNHRHLPGHQTYRDVSRVPGKPES